MDFLKKFFPLSFRGTDVKSLVISIVIYIIVGFVAGLVISLLMLIPILNILIGLVGTLVDLYCLAGIVISALWFAKVIK